MATEQDTSNREALRPQTPAARRRNPEAHQRTTEERERLREESRARRRARAEGRVVPLEPEADQITVRRLSEPEPAATPPAPPAPAPPEAAPPSALTPSTPAGAAVTTKPPSPGEPADSAGEETPEDVREEAPNALREEAPNALREEAPNALRDEPPEVLRREPPGLLDTLGQLRDEVAEAFRADRLEALRKDVPRGLRDTLGGLRDQVAEAFRGRSTEALREESTAPEALRDEPPAPAVAAGPAQVPRARRQRALALLGLASAVGVVAALAASLGSGHLPGLGGGIRTELKSPAVVPGGWLTLTGTDAPGGEQLVLQSRTGDGPWRNFATATADGDGDFTLRGRVLQRPGRLEVRARGVSAGTTSPLAVTVRPLRLAAVGDINLGDQPGDAIAASGPKHPWQSVGPALREADLSFGNLETAISTRGEPFPKEYNFRGTPAALAGLRRNSGIDVLNLANNHVGDYGPVATLDTVRGVERLGMKAVGAGPNLRRALEPQVVEKLGLRVAFVGFSEIAPVEFAAGRGTPGTAWARPELIARAVQAARRKADIVVATFHWGIEKQTLETAQQRALADVAVRAGAQVVIGAHPHTLQPVRRQGAAIVAYSLGNFVFGARSPETTTTGILELDLTAEGVTKGRWRAARIAGTRPVLGEGRPRRLPLRDSLRMEAGVNLPEL
jgi:hypothetical protein